MRSPEHAATVELLEAGLVADVFAHVLDTGRRAQPCWTYRSLGLAEVGQQEVVLTVVRDDDDGIPGDPLNLIHTLHVAARAGQTVGSGDISDIGGGYSVLGRTAVLYLPALELEGIELPDEALCGLLLPPEELALMRATSPLRVVARLARALGVYPYPVCSDPWRRALPWDPALEGRVFGTRARTGHAQARVIAAGDRARLLVGEPAATTILPALDALAPGEPVVVWTGFEPAAAGLCSWSAADGLGGVCIPDSLAPDASVAGAFLALTPGRGPARWQALEDGFELVLSDTDLCDLRDALRRGHAWSLQLDGGRSFTLEPDAPARTLLPAARPFASDAPLDLAAPGVGELGTTWTSPLDGVQHHAAGGWRRYEPGPVPGTEGELELDDDEPFPEGPAELLEVVLLTDEQELAERVAHKDLSGFVQEVRAAVQEHFRGPSGRAQELALELQLQPGGSVGVKVASRPGLPDEVGHTLRRRLLALAPPPVRGGPVAWQMLFALWVNPPVEV